MYVPLFTGHGSHRWTLDGQFDLVEQDRAPHVLVLGLTWVRYPIHAGCRANKFGGYHSCWLCGSSLLWCSQVFIGSGAF